MVKFLTNRVISVAIVVLGAASANAELVKTPILQIFEDENGTVTESVGYKVTGLLNDEVAMVYTNHLRTATWTVPANLKNVEFLVVGGGGGGGGGATSSYAGAGGGGGGVVTGSIFSLTKDWEVIVTVGKGGDGGEKIEKTGDSSSVTGTGKAENGEPSEFFVEGVQYVKAPGGGGDTGYKTNGGKGGSNSGSRKASSKSHDFNDFRTNLIYMVAQAFGNGGGMAEVGASGGGGGGALQVGLPGTESPRKGGDGGAGLTNSITGVEVVYGSGGGGGQAYHLSTGSTKAGYGGAGAGSGGRYYSKNATAYGTDATSANANQGGGGGGGFARNHYGFASSAGGNGGSGIVVFRFKDPIKPGFKVIVR